MSIFKNIWPFTSSSGKPMVDSGKYLNHPEAVVITCFYNPTNSRYRLKAFGEFYETIKHLNHRVIECVIGDAAPQLVKNQNITTIRTKVPFWHKEAILNKIVRELPAKYKYIFWVDADVLFSSRTWLVDSVEKLSTDCTIVQPFEFCIHLERDQMRPDFNTEMMKKTLDNPLSKNRKMWRSFASNWVDNNKLAFSETYDVHGHVGFAWGARRSVLDRCPLYDKAMIGGADHIVAHAAVGQIPHECIVKSFADDIIDVNKWSKKFYAEIQGKLGYVPGELWHIWHGDITKRNYLKRIQDFTKHSKYVTTRDSNGLYVTNDPTMIDYLMDYFMYREIFDDSLALPYDVINLNQGSMPDIGDVLMADAVITGDPAMMAVAAVVEAVEMNTPQNNNFS